MKKILLSLILLNTLISIAKENPEIISLKTKAIKPSEWYASQAMLWAETLKQKPSTEAWINYYLAARYAQWPNDELKKIADDVAKVSPGSFEQNLINGYQ